MELLQGTTSLLAAMIVIIINIIIIIIIIIIHDPNIGCLSPLTHLLFISHFSSNVLSHSSVGYRSLIR